MVDFAGLVRPKSPNTYLVAPDGLCTMARPDRVAPVFSVSPERLRDAFLNLMREAPRVTEGHANTDPLAYDFVASTALMGFKDDVSVRFLPGALGGGTLAIYSRSRMGYSDLGANRKRVEAWLAALERALC
jgi:uncharacterized protein (DUF1499 family)